MRKSLVALFMAAPLLAYEQNPVPATAVAPVGVSNRALPADPPTSPGLLAVRRVYVAQLTGGVGAIALRELIISSLDGTRLFILTDDPEHADATLKGAADDQAFIDSFDSDKGADNRTNGGGYGSNSKANKIGAYGGMSVSDRESHHTRERKHEAYAAVRLCSRTGDVLWSTTQESLGGKFRSASADVAVKIARQLSADYEVARTTPGR